VNLRWGIASFGALLILALALLSSGIWSTSEEVEGAELEQAIVAVKSSPGDGSDPRGWTEESHSKGPAPNYEVVFPRDRVNELTLTIAPDDWDAMWADTAEFVAEQVEVGGGVTRAPMWVPALVEFDGKQWTNVGVRHKGQGTRWGAWDKGSLKMSLKLDFDEFEDDYPEIKNQRFYGFKQLSFANNIWDESYLRETIAYDLLEEAGLVAARTAHYVITVKVGSDSIRLGLYTAIEVIDDTVVRRHFGDNSGNIYKAAGGAASLAEGTLEYMIESFKKENNKKAADWSDLEALYSVLHSAERISNPQAWRSNLESVFDVDTFLKWLAVGAAINQWDTYGWHLHNYYLYNEPDSGRLTWVSWDHDLVLWGELPSLDKSDVGADWPLIRYLLDVPDYHAAYIGYLAEAVNGSFHPDRLEANYLDLAALLAPYAAEEITHEAFEAAFENLIQIAREHAQAVDDFLADQAGALPPAGW
jgi:spore coat protein H